MPAAAAPLRSTTGSALVTVMVTVAVSEPTPLSAVYVKVSVPAKFEFGVYVRWPSACTNALPLAVVNAHGNTMHGAPLPVTLVTAGAGVPVSLARMPGATTTSGVAGSWTTLYASSTAFAGSFTVSVKGWTALGATPLFAVMVSGYGPWVPGPGVPASVAVPSLLLTKVTPVGSAPVWLITIEAPVGKPVVVTVKVPGVPTLKV